MASLVLSSVATNAWGWNWVWAGVASLAGSYIDRAIFAPHTSTTIDGPGMSDLKLTQSSYAVPIPLLWGKGRLPGNIIWASNFKEHVREENQTVKGGKGSGGGGSTTTTRTYWYSVSTALALCEGPILGIGRIWADGQLYAMPDETEATEDQKSRPWELPKKFGKIKKVSQKVSNNVPQAPEPPQSFTNFAELMKYFLAMKDASNSTTYTDKEKDEFIPIEEMTADLTIYKGTEEQSPDPVMVSIEGEGSVPAYRGLAYVVLNNLPLEYWGNRVPQLAFEVYKEDVITIDQIVREISKKAGYADVDIDTTKLAKQAVSSYLVASAQTFRQMIEPLQQSYLFDVIEHNGKVVVQSEPTNPRFTITENDLAARGNGEQRPDTILTTKTSELELPKKVTVTYNDITNDYAEAAVTSSRIRTNTQNEKSIGLPIALTPKEAKSIADIALYGAWTHRKTHEFSTSHKYLGVKPGDKIKLSMKSGKNVLCKAHKIDYGKPGLLKISAVDMGTVMPDRYVPSPIETKWIPPVVINPNDLQLFIKNIPLLQENNNEYSPYMAAYFEGTDGMAIYRSDDKGKSFKPVACIGAPAYCGKIIYYEQVGNAQPYFIDRTSSITVQLKTGALYSQEEMSVLNGENVMLINDEIIQFLNADYLGDNTYKLTGLLRGRRGTEGNIREHPLNSDVLVIRPAPAGSIMQFPIRDADVSCPVLIRYGPINKDVSDDAYYSNKTIFISGSGVKPYSPCHLKCSMRGASGANLEIEWVRRTRVGGAWTNNSDVPLGEENERYEVDLTYNGIKKTFTAINCSLSIDANTQNTIWSTNLSGKTITLSIYQMSTVVGRGYPRTEIINL